MNPANPPQPLSDSGSNLVVKLFGGFSAYYRGRPLSVGKKQAALLSYLALSQNGIANRDRIVGLLWSGHSGSRARGNLRQVLKNLRDLLSAAGFRGLEVPDSKQLLLHPDTIEVDAILAVSAISSFRPPAFLLEQKGIHETLMQDFEGMDSEFDNWIYLQRHTFRDRLTLQLENALAVPTGNHTRNLAHALYNLDPSNEVAVRALMRVYATENNFPGALRVYADLVDLLDSDYGMGPTAETENLAVEIKMAETTPVDVPEQREFQEPLAISDSPPSLLVEAFNTDLVPADKVYIVVGFRHDLLASLARFRDWRIVEQSLQLFAEQSGGLSGKQYVLRAHTYMDESELQLVFTAIDAGSGGVIWSQSYQLRMESWLTTQKQIVRKLAIALNINISADRLNNISRHRQLPAALHDRWLLGQSRLFQWDPVASAAAEKIFRSILSEAGGYAPAYSSLVQLENIRHLVFPGVRRKQADDDSTIELARQAVQIDPIDSKTHLCLAWSLCMSGRFDEALGYFESAVALNENDPWTIVSTAQGYAFCAQYDRARMLISEADELGLSTNKVYCAYQVGTKFLYGDYQGAVLAAEKAGDMIFNIRAWKSAALVHLGQPETAQLECRKFLALIRSNWYGAQTEPADEDIAEWLLHCFPIRGRPAWGALRDGLVEALLPVPVTVFAPH